MWLATLNLLRANDRKALHTVVAPTLRQRFQFRLLAYIRGHHQLPALAMWYVVLGAEFEGQAIAFNAMPSLKRTLRIVDARMDHTAVARAGSHAQFRKLFHQKNILPALR